MTGLMMSNPTPSGQVIQFHQSGPDRILIDLVRQLRKFVILALAFHYADTSPLRGRVLYDSFAYVAIAYYCLTQVRNFYIKYRIFTT